MKIIFLTYINRSGSTFLMNALNKHQKIAVCPEADILANLLLVKPHERSSVEKQKVQLDLILNDEKFNSWGLSGINECISDSIEDNFSLFKCVLKKFLAKYKPEASHIVYKAERLFQLIPNIIKLNNDQTQIMVISLVRDIRAVYQSQTNTLLPKTGIPFSTNPVKTALYWNSYVKSIKKFPVQNRCLVKYEELIASYDKVFAEIIAFLGLNVIDINSSFYSLSAFLDSKQKAIHKNIDSSPILERIDAWINEIGNRELKMLEISAKHSLKYLNYPLRHNKKYSVLHYLSTYILIVNELYIKLMNFIAWRIQNIRSYISEK